MNSETMATMMSSENEHWNTPKRIVDLLTVGWGRVHLDPCSNIRSLVNAMTSYYGPNINLCGLTETWVVPGLVYVNPPYGRKIPAWIHKANKEAKLAAATQTKDHHIIALVPSRTDTRWFQAAMRECAAVHFWSGRLTFLGADAPAPFPSALLYWGADPKHFASVVAGTGVTYITQESNT